MISSNATIPRYCSPASAFGISTKMPSLNARGISPSSNASRTISTTIAQRTTAACSDAGPLPHPPGAGYWEIDFPLI